MIRIPRGCVLWLDLTEDTGNILYDHSGHGNNGKVYGAVLEKRLPFIGRYFDGVDDYGITQKNIGISGSNTCTVVTWFNFIEELNPHQRILGWGAPENSKARILALNNHRLEFIGWNNDLVGKTVLEPNRWYFAAVTVDLDGVNNIVSIYINDKLDARDTLSELLNTTDSPAGIGIMYNQFSYYHYGYIAHISIYNRALNLLEIKYLYEEFQKRVFRRIAPLEIKMR